MIVGSLIMPRITSAYQKKKRKKREQERQTKYKAYLDKINTKIYHFKDLGLESESLGFIAKNFSDRTLINTNKIIGATLAVGGAVGIGALIKYFKG